MRSIALLVLLPAFAVAGSPPKGKASFRAVEPSCPPQDLPSRAGGRVAAPQFRDMPGMEALRIRWRAKVGRTTFRTTMALLDGQIWIGTHGATLDGKDEPSDGVYVLDARTGAQKRFIPTPGSGDKDVGGIALYGGRVFFSTDNGQLVAANVTGGVAWTLRLSGKVRPAPAVGDLDGDKQGDVVVGDERGELVAARADDGRVLWAVQTGENDYGARGFIGSAAIGDVDGDGVDDVVAGARDGVLRAYRGRDGKCLWAVKGSSGIHASPQMGDLDGDGRKEVLAAWSYGDVAILDAATGSVRWEQTLERDDGGIEGLFATPTPLRARETGFLVAPTAWWNDADGMILVGERQRVLREYAGRVSSSAVVADLEGGGEPVAVVGTEKGMLFALYPGGTRRVLTGLGGPIEATPLFADVDADGTLELLVASNDGKLSCFSTRARSAQTSRFRGRRAENRGDLGNVILGWKLAPAARTPAPQPAKGELDRH